MSRLMQRIKIKGDKYKIDQRIQDLGKKITRKRTRLLKIAEQEEKRNLKY